VPKLETFLSLENKDMAYAIARLKKLKRGNIAGSASHTSRQRETPNANPSKENIRFIGSTNPQEKLEDLVLAKIHEQQQRRKIRTDAVYCVEMLLSASPSYFRPESPTNGGYYEQDRLDTWMEATHQWMTQKYGDRIVRAELHLDEVTPHIHAYFVPIDDHGQLRCNHFFDGREKIRAFQDSYYDAMQVIGLERGLKGSRARHSDIKDFYRIVETGRDLEVDELNQEQILAKAADRERAVRQKGEMEATAKVLARQNELLEKRIHQLEEYIEKLARQTLLLRELPLEDVAIELGLERDSSISSAKWLGHGHIIEIDGEKFQEKSPGVENSGGAIDLVIHVNDCNTRQALVWLHEHFGELEAQRAAIAKARSVTAEIIQLEPRPKFTPPAEDQSKWQAVHDYLTQQRGLPSNFVQRFHELGLIYADQQQNAVFLMRDFNHEVQGAYLLATTAQENAFSSYSIGTKRRGSWFHFQLGQPEAKQVQKVVLCSSPLDAFSCAMFELELTQAIPKQRTLYMAIDDPKSIPVERLQHIPQIKVAFNPDDNGEAAAKEIKKILPQAKRLKPKTQDWNQRLLALRSTTKHKHSLASEELSL
jgi:hypothetical protein